MTLRNRIHCLLRADGGAGRAGRIVTQGLVLLIVANVAAMMLASLEPDGRPLPTGYAWFERFSVLVFTVEYALRLWSASEDPRYATRFGRLRWAGSPFALADLLAIAPFWIELALPLGVDLRVVRMLRLLRIARLGKLGRYSVAMQAIGAAVRAKLGELVSVLLVLGVLLVVASTLMYSLEHDANPAAFPSIPAAMWWGIATLTTVGYGDAVPTTAVGKLLGAVIAVLGIGIFALPAAILSGAFTERLRPGTAPQPPATCPHCGRALDATPHGDPAQDAPPPD